MKTKLLISAICLMAALSAAMAQQNRLPDVPLYTLDGEEISANAITNDGMPMIMTFWKTSKAGCCEQLDQLNTAYEDILKQQGVKMVAVCIDCSGVIQHVKPYAYGHNLSLEVYVDKNGEFKRAMGISDAPYSILFDSQMNAYCKQAGFCANIEEVVCQKINECISAMKEKQP